MVHGIVVLSLIKAIKIFSLLCIFKDFFLAQIKVCNVVFHLVAGSRLKLRFLKTPMGKMNRKKILLKPAPLIKWIEALMHSIEHKYKHKIKPFPTPSLSFIPGFKGTVSFFN